MVNTIDQKAITAFMKTQGYERISDYVDMGACAPPIMLIMQFFNPETKLACQICFGEYDDQLTLSEDHIIEVQERWGLKSD